MRKITLAISVLAATTLTVTSVSTVLAHGENSHAAAIGSKGEAAAVARTINITMLDNKFEPADLSVKAGETIRFVVTNAGDFVHEFNIGNRDMHLAHQKEMMMMMEMGALEADRINHDKMGHGSEMMKHDDPNAVLLEPGMTGEVVWMFPESGQLQAACNVPGHYEDGMLGSIMIRGGKSS